MVTALPLKQSIAPCARKVLQYPGYFVDHFLCCENLDKMWKCEGLLLRDQLVWGQVRVNFKILNVSIFNLFYLYSLILWEQHIIPSRKEALCLIREILSLRKFPDIWPYLNATIKTPLRVWVSLELTLCNFILFNEKFHLFQNSK